ncbi:hypothetical protein OIO90_004100 [Microbotryomycetes sp. JL221]|nr:hypothetical protein OIO90_004100 [Microbotryomycetes sp. JL221]
MTASSPEVSVNKDDASQMDIKKPYRHMIARGAARRKLKCDAQRPACSQCIKTATKAKEQVCCTYDGQGTVAAAKYTGVSPAQQSSVTVKRSRDTSLDRDDGDSTSTRPVARKRTSAGSSGNGAAQGQRVEDLVSRINELENKLKAQAERQVQMPPSNMVPVVSSTSPSSATTTTMPSLTLTPDVSMSHATRYVAPTSIPPTFTTDDRSYTVQPIDNQSRQVRMTSIESLNSSFPFVSESSTNRNSSSSSLVMTPGFSSSSPSSFIGQQPLSAPSPATAALFDQFSNAMAQNDSPSFVSAIPSRGIRFSNVDDGTSNKSPSDLFATSAPLMTGGSTTSEGGGATTNSSFDFSPGTTSISYGSAVQSPDDFDTSLWSLFNPGWPHSLPPPAVVRHLVVLFFTRATVPSQMLSQARFMASLELPPLSPGFPETALLHAICGYVVVTVAEDALKSVSNGVSYWGSEPNPRSYHYKHAKRSIDEGLIGRKNVFQLVQASILTSYIAYQTGLFTELWIVSGTMTRLLTPLQLNHIPPFDYMANEGLLHYPEWRRNMRGGKSAHGIEEGLVGPVSGKASTLMPPAKDLDEYIERVKTFWLAFAIDRHASAATDWSPAIDELDISTHLPCETLYPGPELEIDRHLERIHALSIKSPNFFDPPPANVPIGSFGIYVKGCLLMGRVSNFLQRLPRYTQVPPGYTCATYRDAVAASPQFQELDLALAKFRNSSVSAADFEKSLGMSDGCMLISAYCVPHVATLLLHEPMVDEDDRSPTSSLAMSLRSATCVVRALTLLYYSSSSDCFGIDPFLSFTWSVVGRCLVRDFAVRRRWKDDQAQLDKAQQSRDLAWQCLMAVKQCADQSKGMVGISVAIASNLAELLQDPDKVVPFYNLSEAELEERCKRDDPRVSACDWQKNALGKAKEQKWKSQNELNSQLNNVLF